MSYILEALKKSQRARELGQVPDLTAEPYTDSAATRPSMRPWILGALGIALAALLIALYGVFGRQWLEQKTTKVQIRTADAETVSATKNYPPEKTVAIPATIRTTKMTAEEMPSQVISTPEPVRSVQQQTERKPHKEPSTAATHTEPVVSKPISKQTEVEKIRQEYVQMLAAEKRRATQGLAEKTPQQEQKEKKAPAIAPATPSNPPMDMAVAGKSITLEAHELPADVLSRLPARNIMLQSYSEDPAQRFVILNSVKLYQGQGTADGLKVLEIRTDGLLFEFEGHQFLQPR